MNRRFLVCALMGWAMCLCGPIQALDLSEALGEVLNTNPRVLEKIKQYNAAVKDMKRADTTFKPTLNVEAEAGKEWVSNSTTRFSEKDAWIRGSRVVGRQLLFDGNRTRTDVKAREAIAMSELYSYLDVANQLTYDTIESYMNVLKYLDLMHLAQENIDIHLRLLEAVKTRVEAGKEGKSESERVMGRLAAAQSTLIARQNDYKKAVFSLHKHLGRIVEGEELAKPVFQNELLPVALTEAFKKQIENHPMLKAADFNIEEKEWEHRREKSEYNPTVALEASKDWRTDFNGINGHERDTRVMVKYQHNLFDGGARKFKTDRMVSLINREKMIRDRVKRSVVNDLQLTWTAYKLLDTQIGALRKSLFFTKKALNSYKEEFKIGKRLLINILDAENEYQNARAQLSGLQYDLVTQKYRVLYAMGTLIQDLKMKAPFAEDLIDAKRPKVATKDRLPLDPDLDNDSVVDARDISPNSLAEGGVDPIGESQAKSQLYFNEVTASGTPVPEAEVKAKSDLQENRIKPNVPTVISFVSFIKNSVELTDESKRLMRELIEQLKPFSGEALMRITVAATDAAAPELNPELALQRAYNLKKILITHNLDGDAILVAGEAGKPGSPENTVTVLVQTDLDAFCDLNKSITRRDLVFASGSATLEPLALSAVDSLGAELQRLGCSAADIVVSSNDYGDPARDDELSLRRAQAIREAMQKKGALKTRLTPVGWGNYLPGIEALGMTGADEIKNKVEFILRD